MFVRGSCRQSLLPPLLEPRIFQEEAPDEHAHRAHELRWAHLFDGATAIRAIPATYLFGGARAVAGIAGIAIAGLRKAQFRVAGFCIMPHHHGGALG